MDQLGVHFAHAIIFRMPEDSEDEEITVSVIRDGFAGAARHGLEPRYA